MSVPWRCIAASPHAQWLVALTPLAARPVRARECSATARVYAMLANDPDTSVRIDQRATRRVNALASPSPAGSTSCAC